MESVEVSQVSQFAEQMSTEERSYGKICEQHRSLVSRNIKFLVTVFDLKKKEKLSYCITPEKR